MCVCSCGCVCVCVHISTCSHFRYKYQSWLTVSSVWVWQLLFVVVDRLLVNGWRFEVPCLSLFDGCRALLWIWLTVHCTALSASMHSAYMAPTGCFSDWLELKRSWEDSTYYKTTTNYWFLFVVNWHVAVLYKATDCRVWIHLKHKMSWILGTGIKRIICSLKVRAHFFVGYLLLLIQIGTWPNTL